MLLKQGGSEKRQKIVKSHINLAQPRLLSRFFCLSLWQTEEVGCCLSKVVQRSGRKLSKRHLRQRPSQVHCLTALRECRCPLTSVGCAFQGWGGQKAVKHVRRYCLNGRGEPETTAISTFSTLTLFLSWRF